MVKVRESTWWSLKCFFSQILSQVSQKLIQPRTQMCECIQHQKKWKMHHQGKFEVQCNQDLWVIHSLKVLSQIILLCQEPFNICTGWSTVKSPKVIEILNFTFFFRGPPAYGLPHARLPPYPFHHLHPNLRPGEYCQFFWLRHSNLHG